MKYSVLVNTCDKFEDCWNPFFKLFSLYWRDYKGKIYLNTEYKDYSFPGLDIIPVKGCVGKKINGRFATWSQCLKWALDSIPEDIILYLQEDYFLKSQVQTSMIDDAVKLMLENKDIKCIHLTDQGCSTFGSSAYEGYDQCVLHDKYRVSCQAALWYKDELYSLLREWESAWEFEQFGSKRSAILNHTYIAVSSKVVKKDCFEILPYVFTGIVKGRWYEETIPLFEKHDIVIDWSKRGLLSEVKSETFLQKTKRRMGRVPRYMMAYLDLFQLSIGRYI